VRSPLWAALGAAALAVALGGSAGPARTEGAPAPLSRALAARLAGAGGPVPVIVTLRAPPGTAALRGAPLLRDLRAAAARPLPAPLARAGARSLWLVGALSARLRPEQIARLRRDPRVARIDEDPALPVLAGSAAPAPAPTPFARGDWGLAAIGAPDVWRDRGLDGSGVRVGTIDTGVDATHPDLRGKVLAWRDFVAGRPAPYDDSGHGTHTAATIVGGGAGGPPIGVAPGARLVVAKALDEDGRARVSTLLAAGQWIADPDGNPATADAPSVISASWAAPDRGTMDALHALVRRWRDLGIVPVFAAGNAGTRRGVEVPGAWPEALAVGALGVGGRVAGFSSRDTALPAGTPLKPDLVAPGVDVVSARAGGGYASRTGTSMAAPHVAGVVALLRQAAPRMPARALENLLRATARDVGAPGPDRASGAGLVDADAALAAVLGPALQRPGLSLIALPPRVTNARTVSVAVASGGAPVATWLDGRRLADTPAGALVRIPIASAGRHALTVAAVAAGGGIIGAPAWIPVTIDRTPPAVHVVVRRAGLLRVRFRATASDDVAGVLAGSVNSRSSDAGRVEGPADGRHAFAGHGPYWIEVRASDRAGNVRRVRIGLSWPAGAVARRLAWGDAFVAMAPPFLAARLRRRVEGRYGSARSLALLLRANWPYQRFVTLPTATAAPARGEVGVFTDGRRRVRLSVRFGPRSYWLEDDGDRVRRGVVDASAR
jgi:subtilisin family serine protease